MKANYERPGDTPQQKGRRFEKFWSKFFGVAPVKGSGNQWYAKLDVNTTSFLFSLKHTDKSSFTITKNIVKEVEDAIHGQGGIGGSTIGAVATSVEGEVFVVFRGEDFLRMVQSGDFAYVVPSKAEQKRARSRVPALLRDEEATD